MSDEEVRRDTLTAEQLEGYRKAHRAALYAHLRSILAQSSDKRDPLLGLHAVGFFDSGRMGIWSAGMTPPLPVLMSGIGWLQGKVVSNFSHGLYGDHKRAESGDRFDPALGKARCVGCDDGDPAGAHAEEELRENARAWLGLLVGIALDHYGKHLPGPAVELLSQLSGFAIEADAKIS